MRAYDLPENLHHRPPTSSSPLPFPLLPLLLLILLSSFSLLQFHIPNPLAWLFQFSLVHFLT